MPTFLTQYFLHVFIDLIFREFYYFLVSYAATSIVQRLVFLNHECIHINHSIFRQDETKNTIHQEVCKEGYAVVSKSGAVDHSSNLLCTHGDLNVPGMGPYELIIAPDASTEYLFQSSKCEMR